jgi:hypothetical protein
LRTGTASLRGKKKPSTTPRKRSGYARAAKRFNACDEELISVGLDLLTTKPKTIAGVAALITYASQNQQDLLIDEYDVTPFLQSLADALNVIDSR